MVPTTTSSHINKKLDFIETIETGIGKALNDVPVRKQCRVDRVLNDLRIQGCDNLPSILSFTDLFLVLLTTSCS